MDPFDEFEFKPLTNGLGFHKKQTSLSDDVKDSGVLEDELEEEVPEAPPSKLLEEDNDTHKDANPKQTFEDLLAALEKTDPKSKETAVATESKAAEPSEQASEPTTSQSPERENPVITPSVPPMDPPRSTPTPRHQPSVTQQQPDTRFRAGAGGKRVEPVSMSLASSMLDLMMIVGLSLLFLAALVAVTDINLLNIMARAQTQITVRASLVVLFVAVMQMYVIIARSFFGATLGEWTFDLQMGQEAQQQSAFYPFLLAWRSLLVVVTGLLFFPLISLIAGRDILYYLTGLHLYRQKT